MSSPIEKLTVRQLVQVLKHARGGNIGFDPFRDPRTSTRASLLKFLLETHTNEQIIAGISSLDTSKQSEESEVVTVEVPTIGAYDGNFTVKTHYEAEKAKKAWEYRKDLKTNVETAKSPAIPPSNNTDPAQELAVLLRKLAAENSRTPLDKEAVLQLIGAQAFEDDWCPRSEVDERVEKALEKIKRPTVVSVHNVETKTTTGMGIQHKAFPTLLKMAQARTRDGLRLNIWLKGPAGSGKTVAAKHTATALELQFQFNGAISTEYELMGFKDAHGTYHRTAFREIFENGGVYLFDEVDSSLPKAVLAFNAALANGECRFPDSMIQRHKDCVIIAGANTAGQGANSEYVGRMKQDLAFLNRFVMLDWPLDEALETALATNADWVSKVQRMRLKVSERAIKNHIISPRATFYGEALLAVGIDRKTVEECVLKGALSDDTWRELCR